MIKTTQNHLQNYRMGNYTDPGVNKQLSKVISRCEHDLGQTGQEDLHHTSFTPNSLPEEASLARRSKPESQEMPRRKDNDPG